MSEKQLKKGMLVYLPAGEHEITATVNGKPAKRRVRVTAACVPQFQRDLEAMLAASRAGKAARPCGYFDHRTGAAAFLPRGFRWEEGRGVMLDLEWTHAGQAAVEGMDYAYFSPRFFLAGESPAGLLPEGVEVGSLVNDPAFTSIEAVAASRTDGGAGEEREQCRFVHALETVEAGKAENLAPNFGIEKPQKQPHNGGMEKIKTMLGLAPEATEADMIAAIEKLKGKDNTTELEATKGELEKVREEAKKKDEELCAARAEIASLKASNEEAFIAEAVAAGRIAPKDDEAKERWKKLYRADAVSAAAAIKDIKPAIGNGKETVIAGKVHEPKGGDLEAMYAEKNQ